MSPKESLDKKGHSEPFMVRASKIDKEDKPDLDRASSVVLSEGPRSRKEALYLVIRNRHTGEFHHDSVCIKSYKKKAGELVERPEHSVTLSGDKTDEIKTFIDFVSAARTGSIPDETGSFVVVEAPDSSISREALISFLSDLSAKGKIDVLADVLQNISYDRHLLTSLLERATAEPKLFAEAAAALNLVTYRQAYNELRKLVNMSDVREKALQDLLKENPWMFGSEYSDLLEQRKFTRNEEQDFVLRRTADNYIEVIEIKTPLDGQDLFRYDKSHDCYYAGAELSKVVGQVQHYLDQIDASRYQIKALDSEDPFKTRAKIIIGRDGDEAQLQVLRSFNGHMSRIEVITFDQLIRIAKKVLMYLYSALRPSE